MNSEINELHLLFQLERLIFDHVSPSIINKYIFRCCKITLENKITLLENEKMNEPAIMQHSLSLHLFHPSVKKHILLYNDKFDWKVYLKILLWKYLSENIARDSVCEAAGHQTGGRLHSLHTKSTASSSHFPALWLVQRHVLAFWLVNWGDSTRGWTSPVTQLYCTLQLNINN